MVKTETPESLLNNDPDARVFYILNDYSVAVCQKATDLPYHKQRSSYVSAGVYSPSQKQVYFWGDSQDLEKCMDILVASKSITKEYTYKLAGGRKMVIDNANRVKAVSGITRKGHAGFNRLPPSGQGDLKPQDGALQDVTRHIKQGELDPVNASDPSTPTVTPKIQIKFGPDKNMQKQPVQKQVRPRNLPKK